MEASLGVTIDTVAREQQRSAILSFFIRMVKEKPLDKVRYEKIKIRAKISKIRVGPRYPIDYSEYLFQK